MTPIAPLLRRIALQGTEPGPETGPEGLAVFWPLLVQIGWFLVGFIAVFVVGRVLVQPVLERVLRRRNRNNPTLQAAMILYFRLLVLLVGTLVGAAFAGYGQFLNDSALVISAVALVLDSEFNVGDYIRWEGGEGVVQSIALRVTRVETADGELVTIPNTILTAHELVRPYGRGSHRIVQELGVDYDEDLDDVLDQVTDVARDTDGILDDPPPVAFVDGLGDDEVVIRVQYWITDPTRRDIFAVRSAYTLAVKERLEAEGISISPATERELSGRLRLDQTTEE